MIRVDRGEAPKSLKAIRTHELRRVREQRRRNEKIDFGNLYRTKEIRETLHKRQYRKCCYCEVTIRRKGNDVDHFRPKGKAIRGAGMPENGYWWLAWDWGNLLFACTGCNTTKGDHFPLDPRGKVLPQGRKPPGPERPLLIDPASEDPLEHIGFHPMKGQWRPIWLSRRGEATIRRIGLHNPDLIDLYNDHVQKHIARRIRRIRKKMEENDHAGVRSHWNEAVRVLLSPSAPFRLLAHDVLDQAVPPRDRSAFKLFLPKPRPARCAS